MKDIQFFLRDSGYLIYLTDEDGYIISLTGDFSTISDLEKNFNFKVGASWHENTIGTTAVGVALNNQISVPYMSSEKFCYDLRTTSCCATPLKNATDELIGCIGVAANFKDMNRSIFGIILSAKVGIENQLRLQQYHNKFAVLRHYYRSVFNSVSDAIITIDNYGVICEINACAEKLINEKAKNIVGKRIEDILDFKPVLRNLSGYFNTKSASLSKQSKYRILKDIPKTDLKGRPNGRIIFLASSHKKTNL